MPLPFFIKAKISQCGINLKAAYTRSAVAPLVLAAGGVIVGFFMALSLRRGACDISKDVQRR